MTAKDFWKFEKEAEKLAQAFNLKSKYIDVYFFTNVGIDEGYSSNLTKDISTLSIAIYLIVFYCVTAMGSWSPIHFRSGAAAITFLCVGLSYTSATGIGFLCGFKSATVHNLVPYLLLGVGVDDMFVFSMAIDQTSARDKDIEQKMRNAMVRAG